MTGVCDGETHTPSTSVAFLHVGHMWQHEGMIEHLSSWIPKSDVSDALFIPKSGVPEWSIILFVAVFVLVPFGIGWTQPRVTDVPDWKQVRPAATPPDWVFAFVWPVLYAVMGTALFLFLREPFPTPENAPLFGIKVTAIVLFGALLALNWAWVPVFGRGDAESALALVLSGSVVTLMCAFLFAPVSAPAAALLAPLFVWYGFATYLNARVIENRAAAEHHIM